MTITDFEPTEYMSPDGSIRARKDGLLWSGEALDDWGQWVVHARGCTGYYSAIALTLVALGLDEEDDYQTGRDPDLPF